MSFLLEVQKQVFEAIGSDNNAEIANTLNDAGIKADRMAVRHWRLGTKKLSDMRLQEIANLYNIKISFNVEKDCIL